MSRMSGPQRKRKYDELVRQDGEFCFIGGEKGDSDTFVIDHWDNDNSNNEPSNLHLMCKSMNSAKNPRGRGKKERILSSERESASEINAAMEPVRSTSAEFVKNQRSEPAFRHWLFMEIIKYGRLELNDVINTGAAVAGCGQQAIRRYLAKETSRVRLYHIVKDSETGHFFVEFRPKWGRFRLKLIENKLLEKQSENWKEELLHNSIFVDEEAKRMMRKSRPDEMTRFRAEPKESGSQNVAGPSPA